MNAQLSTTDRARGLIDTITDDLQTALPPTITLERMKAAFITAVMNEPKILNCDQQTIHSALLKAAQDNLLPDSREAVILPFKDTKSNTTVAQYIPMVAGIRKRAKELGGIPEIICECVHDNDFFEWISGDNPSITHKPVKLGQPRGDIIGAYAIFKDESGRIVHREIMTRAQIEKARAVSRANAGPGWSNWYSEMCRKTAIRRGIKGVPTLPEPLRVITMRDDDYVDLTPSRKAVPENHNPLIEHRPDPGVSTDPSMTRDRQPAARQETAASQQQNKQEKAVVDRSRLVSTRSDFEGFHAEMLRLNQKSTLDKGRSRYWAKKKTDGATGAEVELEQEIWRAHVLRIDGKLSAEDCGAHVAELIADLYGDAS